MLFAFPSVPIREHELLARGPESDVLACVFGAKGVQCEIQLTSFNPTLVAEQDRSLRP